MRALPPRAGDLRGLAFEPSAVPSAVRRLDAGRLHIEWVNEWVDQWVDGRVDFRRNRDIAIAAELKFRP